jgi:hypothetical protein
MSAILEETIEEVRSLPPEDQKQVRELKNDFSELLKNPHVRDFLLLLLAFWLFSKMQKESEQKEWRELLDELSKGAPQGLLIEDTTSMQPGERIREQQWIDTHRNEYLGQWVVVEGDQLIVHGHDARKVYEAARANGIDVPFLVRVHPAESAPSMGGW